MGTKVHCKSYLPGCYSMRDLNEDSSSSNWPLLYGDQALANGQYSNGFLTRTVTNAYSGYEKYALKQTMLGHEAIFKRQVFELHRLYKRQKDMMNEIRRKELYNHRIPIETSSSSSHLVSEMPSEDAQKWQKPNFALNFTEGNGKQASRVPFHNGCSSKDCEILESRPSKIRKKLFDLQLPADEYIDTEEGEQYPDNHVSDLSSYPPSENHKIASGSSEKLNIGGVPKIDIDGDASRSVPFSKNSVGLADLNEPILVDEVTLPTSADFIGRVVGHGEIKDLDLAAKTKSKVLLGLPKETLQNSQHGSNNENSLKLHIENKGDRRDWLSYIYEEGHRKTNLNSIPHGLQSEKSAMSSQLKHSMVNKAHQPVGLSSDRSREDQWRARMVHSLELSEKSHDFSSFSHLEPVVASHASNPYPLLHSSDVDNFWSRSISTLGKPSSSLTQKWASIQPHPPLNSLGSLSKSSQMSTHSHETSGDKWHLHSSAVSKPGFGSGLPNCNGFYQGSASGSNDVPTTHLPSVGFGYLNCIKDDKVASERLLNYSPRSYFKGSNVTDMSAKDMDWNTVLSKCSSNEIVPQQGLEIIDKERKCEEHLKGLPWLTAKPTFKNEGTHRQWDSNSSEISFLQAPSNQLSSRNETIKGTDQHFTQNSTLASCDLEGGAKRHEAGDCLVNRKILGFPIFDNPCTPRNESSSLVSTSASLRCTSGEAFEKAGKAGVIDINVACDPECSTQIAAEVLIVEKERDKGVANFRTYIDLNSCVTEDEVALVPSVASTGVNVKIAVEIDLEAPAFPDIEEEIPPAEVQHCEMPSKSPQHKTEQHRDEVVSCAAEAIIAAQAMIAISSCVRLNCVEETTCHPSEAPEADSLLWFAEVVSSFEYDLDTKFGTESKGNKNGGDNETSSCDEIDDFEAMTLNLTETKEEEYMPPPLVPDIQSLEESGNVTLPNRPRKGQARRGRQRRDFQRDILPGLASLSRHEVTEDLQTFGGLMKATGHAWHSGLTRRNGTRNGGGRGRRRLVVDPEPAVAVSTICTPLMQQLNSIEFGLEDRSLTGWGKTPRRPRRQRCPAGNLPSIPST